MLLNTFRWPLLITLVALVGALAVGGPSALALVAILAVLEISLSFDNAVVNATVLERMNPFWQKIFLSVGIIIAVFGMRLIFPLLIVALTAHISPAEVVHKALQGGGVDTPGSYANLLQGAHPAIAAFGGVFLLMLFLDFVFEEREIAWLAWLERPLAKVGKLDQLSVVVALVLLVVASQTWGEDHATSVLVSGILGLAVYLFVGALGDLFEEAGEKEDEDPSARSAVLAAGKAAFFLFLYLEVLDASFSFDGVIGAFAISQNIFIIAVGLGIGAMYIRSLTVFLVRKGTLAEYVYLEHGAMWAIGALAVILLISINHGVPEVITGLIGVAFIALAFISSVIAKDPEDVTSEAELVEQS